MNGGKTTNASQALTRVQVPPKGGFFLNPRLLLVPVDDLLLPFEVLLQFPGRPWSGVRRGLKCWKFSLVYVLPFAHRPRLTGSVSFLYALRLAVSCIANNKNTERLSEAYHRANFTLCLTLPSAPVHGQHLSTPSFAVAILAQQHFAAGLNQRDRQRDPWGARTSPPFPTANNSCYWLSSFRL